MFKSLQCYSISPHFMIMKYLILEESFYLFKISDIAENFLFLYAGVRLHVNTIYPLPTILICHHFYALLVLCSDWTKTSLKYFKEKNIRFSKLCLRIENKWKEL